MRIPRHVLVGFLLLAGGGVAVYIHAINGLGLDSLPGFTVAAIATLLVTAAASSLATGDPFEIFRSLRRFFRSPW
jgi:hypothetical protein